MHRLDFCVLQNLSVFPANRPAAKWRRIRCISYHSLDPQAGSLFDSDADDEESGIQAARHAAPKVQTPVYAPWETYGEYLSDSRPEGRRFFQCPSVILFDVSYKCLIPNLICNVLIAQPCQSI